MSIRKYKISIAAISLIFPCIAFGGEDYKCKIENTIPGDRKNIKVIEMYKSSYIGKEFTVERSSGVMAGALKNSYITKPKIIDIGSKVNAYKVVTTLIKERGAGAGSNVYYLTIAEYEESNIKPFVFVENSNVYFGSCEHY